MYALLPGNMNASINLGSDFDSSGEFPKNLI